MDNKQLYKKTIGFSFRRLFWNMISLVLVLVLGTLGFMLSNKLIGEGLIGLLIGVIVGIVAAALISHFISYILKAGQIAMMTRGITEGELPENVIAEGRKVVKSRFGTVAAYYAITNVIKGIFNQLGRGLTSLGQSIGGDTGGAVGSAVSSAIQTVVSYLCDCCLGWVFYRKDVKAAKATCEGAVLFFKYGKTLAKNMGRVFGMGLVSLLLIGGAFTGIFYAILSTQQAAMKGIYDKVAEVMQGSEGKLAQILSNPATLPVFFALIGGIIIWSFIHSTFIRPFVLTGVLRNYLNSGMNDIPSEESFALLDSKSPKFRKLHNEL